MIAAGLDGVEKGLTLGDPVEESLFEMDAARIAEKGIRELPGTLGEAIDELERDPVIARGPRRPRPVATTSTPSAPNGTSTAPRSPAGSSTATSKPSEPTTDPPHSRHREQGDHDRTTAPPSQRSPPTGSARPRTTSTTPGPTSTAQYVFGEDAQRAVPRQADLQEAPPHDRGPRAVRPGDRRRGRARREGVGDGARRHPLHALVRADDRLHGREARLVPRPRPATAATVAEFSGKNLLQGEPDASARSRRAASGPRSRPAATPPGT